MVDPRASDSRGAADYALDALDRATAVRTSGAGTGSGAERRGAVSGLTDLPGLDFSFSSPSFLSGRSRWVLFCLLAAGGFLSLFLAYRMAVDAPAGHGAEWVVPPVMALLVGLVAFALAYAAVMGFGQVKLTTSVGPGAGTDAGAKTGAGPAGNGASRAPDAPAFGVSSVAPADRAVDVPATTSVSATFSAAVSAATISPTSFTLRKDGAAAPIAATVTVDPDGLTAQLRPGSSLDPGATYYALVSGSIEDATGRSLVRPITWTFTTAAALGARVGG